MGCPGGTKQGPRLFREVHVAVFGALATMHMDLETRAIEVGDLRTRAAWRRRPRLETVVQ